MFSLKYYTAKVTQQKKKTVNNYGIFVSSSHYIFKYLAWILTQDTKP